MWVFRLLDWIFENLEKIDWPRLQTAMLEDLPITVLLFAVAYMFYLAVMEMLEAAEAEREEERRKEAERAAYIRWKNRKPQIYTLAKKETPAR